MRINWNEPKFDEDELREIEKIIRDSYVNEGPKTKELEEELKKYLGVKYVILTANATAGLFLAVMADAVIKGKKEFEVIVPDMTMIATATSVNWAGGKPILVDVEKERGTLDLNKIEEKITLKTTAIIPVHVLGRAVDMEKLNKIAEKYRLSVIEDSAGALGSKQNGIFLGTLGKVGVFSLQSNKIITSGQGGIIVTDDEKYYETIRRLRDFGRLSNKEFIHQEIGYNLKFSDLSAALAIAQFRKIDERKKMLLKQKEIYERELKEIKEIKFFPYYNEEIPLWIDVIVNNRKELIDFLKQNEIYSRECWPAIHQNPPYATQGTDANFPNASFMANNCLWLPNGPAINEEQIIYICNKIKEFHNKGKNQMELKKIHEDKRGFIYLVKDLLEDDKEFTFMEIKNGFARGGCLHSKDENFVVIKGKVRVVSGNREWITNQGESGKFPAGEPHAFIALEDSIVSEWGITTEEKEADIKDPKLRSVVDEANRN